MNVIKRDGRPEPVSFDKVLARVTKASERLHVNPALISQKVLVGIKDGIKTQELDELTMKIAISLCTTHQDYGTLAARIAVSNHQRNTKPRFCEVMRELATQRHPKTGEPISYVSKEILDACDAHEERIEAAMRWERDELFDFFGFKTLEKQYLLKNAEGRVVERPQHLWMRVALALWASFSGGESLEKAFQTYDMMSMKLATHATPTLFNAGTPMQQLSSCFLLAMTDDSIKGIYKTLTDCALISKNAGGIGLHIHNVRAQGSLIRGTNGYSNGIVPMLRNFNATARYVDQCFTPDTIIYTKNGPKAIEDVSVSDHVLTSDGTYKQVKLPVRHEYNGKMLDIQLKNAVYPVRVTPEHQILTLKGQAKGINFDVIKNRLDKNIATPEFCDAGELVEGDFLVFTIPTYEEDISTITEEDCRFYGIMIGDGYISTTTAGVYLNTETKIDAINFVKNYLEKRGVHVTETPKEDSYKCVGLKWSPNNSGFKFTRSQLYDSNKQKHIESYFIHLPVNKIKQLIRGIIETDGCIGEKEISLELTSYSVIESVRYMLLRLGALSSGYERNRVGEVSPNKGILTTLPTAVLRIPRIPEIVEMFPDSPKSHYYIYLKHGDKLYSRIQSITETKYEGVVHDFEIDDPHDYTVAHLGIAHNGGGKRNGSFAIYLEPWHADIEEFLKLKLNQGAEEERARDLFYGLWMPDLFMRRVEEDADWTLFCPNEAPGLADVVGHEFDLLYTRYEKEGRGRRTVSAQKLWFRILDAQIETGTPYLLYKDAANEKSNQQNLGVIKSSNLCTEILEYSSPEETAVCNLASLALPAFVNTAKKTFNFAMLRRTVRQLTQNLNRVIDINYYPTPETRTSNMRHRPIGIGVQGLADVFAMLRLPWETEQAEELNQRIFEHIYYAALDASADIAQGAEDSPAEGTYESFAGSPMSEGKLQPDFWFVVPLTEQDNTLDWHALRTKAQKGIRNSLLVAPMPTASTSQILGYTECFEPVSSNIYTRRTLAGEFIVVNKYLMKDLMAAGIWCEDLKQKIIMNNGSVQNIEQIPREIQDLYKTSYEIKQRTLIDMAAARGAFICQSQSLNLFVADPTYAKLTSMHFYSWKKGLKTGIYYLRSKAPVMAQKFTVDPELAHSVGMPLASYLASRDSELVAAAEQSLQQAPADEGCLLCSA